MIKADPLIKGLIYLMFSLTNSFSILQINSDPIIDLETKISLMSISFFSLIRANRAEDPVPQGDLSSLPGLIQTVFFPSLIPF